MKCPFCQHDDTQVLDTRVTEEGAIRRRRRCGKCDKRFTTYERIELVMPAVVKKNGSRTEYSADKLRGSLSLALRKRQAQLRLTTKPSAFTNSARAWMNGPKGKLNSGSGSTPSMRLIKRWFTMQ